jgi:hypothetical protein
MKSFTHFTQRGSQSDSVCITIYYRMRYFTQWLLFNTSLTSHTSRSTAPCSTVSPTCNNRSGRRLTQTQLLCSVCSMRRGPTPHRLAEHAHRAIGLRILLNRWTRNCQYEVITSNFTNLQTCRLHYHLGVRTLYETAGPRYHETSVCDILQ